jgi:hypothetical protein
MNPLVWTKTMPGHPTMAMYPSLRTPTIHKLALPIHVSILEIVTTLTRGKDVRKMRWSKPTA